MKKTFAILLSLVLVVAAVFALTLTASADVTAVNSVTITDSDGVEHVLQDGEKYSAKTGTATFDAEKGELTIEDLTGVKKIYSVDGALTIIVKGTNTIESNTSFAIHANTSNPDGVYRTDVPSNLLIKGDGVLNVKATEYAIVSQTGSFEVSEKVTLNVESTGKDAIHIASGGTDAVFSGNAVVNVTAKGTYAVRNESVVGSTIVKDNATVNIESSGYTALLMKGTFVVQGNANVSVGLEGTEDWAAGIRCANLQMESGTVSVDVHGQDIESVVVCSAIHVQAAEAGSLKFLGGKVNITVNSDNKVANRLHAFYLYSIDTVEFAGTDFDIVVNTPLAGQKEAGVITSEYVNKFVFTGGTFNVSAPNTTAFITPRNAGTDAQGAAVSIDMSNTTLEGEVRSLIDTSDVTVAEEGKEQSPYVSVINVKFAKSNVADLLTPDKVLGSSSATIVTVDTDAVFCGNMDLSSSAYALVSGDPSVKAITISLTPPVGADIVLNAGKRTLTAAEAKKLGVAQDSVVYDPYNATVTLNNMDGEVNRIYASGDVTYVIKGENAITMLPDAGNAALGSDGTMTVKGDGSLTVTGSTYTMMSGALMTFDGDVKVRIISNSTNAIHVKKGATPDVRKLVVGGNVQLDILALDRGIYIAGSTPIVQITDNAKVTIAPVKETMNAAIWMRSGEDDETGSQDAVVEISGNASLKIDKGCTNGILFSYDLATEQYPSQIAEETAINGIINILDNANVEIASREQGIYYNLNKANNSATLNIADQANVKISSLDAANKGSKLAAIQISSPSNVVTMTTTGTVDLTSNTGGWKGAFYMTGTDYDVLIKDTTLNVTNISSSVSTAKDFNNEVSNAIDFDCTGKGKIVLAGKAVVTAYAEKNGEEYANRAHGLFLQPNHVLTIQDDATFNTTAAGNSKASTGAGIHLKQSFVVVKDNGTLNVLAKGTAVAGITFEGESGLTVEGNAQVTIKGEGEDVVGVRSYNSSAKGTIEVKDGTGKIELYGDPAVSTKNRKLTINSAIMKTGDTKKDAEAVEKITGKEGYVLLAAKNPPTSDLSIAVFAIVGLVAVATTAAVLLRKKHNH